jgi:phosphohistidine phosphatase
MPVSNHRELYILRHAKSDWGSAAESDFERPLAKRGKKDAPAMGRWMSNHKVKIDYVISSPAKRTKQTVHAVVKELHVPKGAVHFDERVYLASVETLLQVLKECPAGTRNLMLVGHNPGLDDLLKYLANEQQLPFTESGKLLTTASLAHLSLPKDWSRLDRHCGKLVSFTRPRDLGNL